MTDDTTDLGTLYAHKLNAIVRLVDSWKAEVEKLDAMAQNWPGDLTTARLVTYNEVVRQIEEILYYD